MLEYAFLNAENLIHLNFSVNGFWDPEKYFDLMKLAKAANKYHANNGVIMTSNACGDGDATTKASSPTTQKRNVKYEENRGDDLLLKSTDTEVKCVDKPKLEIKNIKTISEYLSLSPGSSYEVTFCSLNTENNFYVNLQSLKPTYDELMDAINEYCNSQQIIFIKGNVNDILFAKSITDCNWYRCKIIKSTSNLSFISISCSYDN